MFEEPVPLLQPTFARGEVSPYLFGRVDLQTFASGLRTLRNGFVRTEGAVSNRQGTAYVNTSLLATALSTKLLPFIFSATQSYVIEVGNLSAQVFSNGAVVSGSVATITNVQNNSVIGLSGDTLITTAGASGLIVGQQFQVSGVIGTGLAAINGTWTVTAIENATNFTITTGFPRSGGYTSGGAVLLPISFATPWAAADLPLIKWAQARTP